MWNVACHLLKYAEKKQATSHALLYELVYQKIKMIMFVVRWLVGHLSYQWTVGWFKLVTACACTTSARIIPN